MPDDGFERMKAAGMVREGRSVGEALAQIERQEAAPRSWAAPPMPSGEKITMLRLPFPPSTNTYWRSIPLFKAGKFIRVKVLISENGRKYRRAVARTARTPAPLDGRLAVDVILYPPTRHRRDVDNFGGKALLDSLKYARVYHDDSQIDDLRVRRGHIVPGGAVEVRLRRIEPPQPSLLSATGIEER